MTNNGKDVDQFVARTNEKRQLGNFFERYLGSHDSSSRSCVFIVQAPSGAGKSRLVDECVSQIKDAIHLRINAPHQHSYVGFRTVFLISIVRQYRNIVRNDAESNTTKLSINSPKNKRALMDAITAVSDGVTLGGATALRSVISLINSDTQSHLDDVFRQRSSMEDDAEEVIQAISKQVTFVLTISNAQKLELDDLEYIFEYATISNCAIVLEHTTIGYDHGSINREHMSKLSRLHGIKVSALILSPLRWVEARKIARQLPDENSWAQSYYERHGFNLFDLKNLSDCSIDELESQYIDDFSFGPSVLPGIRNRFPATRRKINVLSKDEQYLICLIYLHGGNVSSDAISSLVSGHILSARLESLLISLCNESAILAQIEHPPAQNYSLLHDSIAESIEDSTELLPLKKIASKSWQKFYLGRFNENNGDALGNFEVSMRLAYFSALIDSTTTLLDACESVFKLSQYVHVEGVIRDTYHDILERITASSLIPTRIRPLIQYYLGASALNFQDVSVARKVLESMDGRTLGAKIIDATIDQREDMFQASSEKISAIIDTYGPVLEPRDLLRIRLTQIINEHNLASDALKIIEVKKKFDILLEDCNSHPEIAPSILKHTSISLGYSESLVPIEKSLSLLKENSNNFEVAQAKLIKLMQLTRLGQLDEAYTLLDELKNAFPKNFAEISNIWNIEAILNCYKPSNVSSGKKLEHTTPRKHFLNAKRLCKDEYRKIVLASNLYVYDHFIDTSANNAANRVFSSRELNERLENSTIRFRYLYVLGWYNQMRYYEGIGDEHEKNKYRELIGTITDHDTLLWRAALGYTNPANTEVEFLVSTPYMFAFLPNYHHAPPSFSTCVDNISEIRSV